MIDLDLQAGLYLLAAAISGVIVGWLIRSMIGSRNLSQMDDQWQKRLDQAVRQRERLGTENASLKTSIEAQQAVVSKHTQAAAKTRTEIESLREKINALTKNSFVLGEERDEFKNKLARIMGLVNTAKQQLMEQQADFAKAGDFYKGQLEGALEQRTALDRKVEDAKSENASLRNLLMSSKAEYESVSNLLATTQSRLENLDEMEQKVIELEAENAELRQETTLAKRRVEALLRDVDEMDALKVQNRELAHCLKSMETSRKQYEEDALRYRNQYEQSEKQSETMRFKLGDIEKNWVEMQRKKNGARDAGSQLNNALPPFGLEAPQGEPDDLKQIVGIGKVFEETLHSLGVYYFRQIAAFGPTEIARINAELKEFRGRIEHDDWIGQAKELHFRKYGNSGKKSGG
jgi:predicted flap endonuclease-1-like 5' DNA nuclease